MDKRTGRADKETFKPVTRMDGRGRLYKTAQDLAVSPIVREHVKWLAEHGDKLLSPMAPKGAPKEPSRRRASPRPTSGNSVRSADEGLDPFS